MSNKPNSKSSYTKEQNDDKNKSSNKRRYNKSSKPKQANKCDTSNNRIVDDRHELSSRGRDNDPNWYFYNSELANEVMNFSFETVLGLEHLVDDVQIPTIATVFCNASPGTSVLSEEQGVYSTSDTMPTSAQYTVGYDGANYMATKLYSLLSANSGRNANYQANDVLMSILSTSSIAEMIESLRRIFGVTYLYSMYNRDVPRALIEAMNVDFDDLIMNYADYKAQVNYQISRINQIPMIANLSFVDKCVRMYQHIYADDNSPLAQLFMYCPASVWVLDEQTYPSGSCLSTTDWMLELQQHGTYTTLWTEAVPSSKLSVAYLISVLTTAIDAVLNSTTLNLVYMDLLHMAEKASDLKFMQFDFISSDYAVMPIYDENALLQFHNLDFAGNQFIYDSSSTTGYITPYSGSCDVTFLNSVISDANTGRIFYNPSFMRVLWPASETVVDFPDGIPSLEDKIEAQRLTSIKSNWHCAVSGISGLHVWPVNVLPDHYPLLMVVHESTIANPNWNDTVLTRDVIIGTLKYHSGLNSTGTLATTRANCSTIENAASALSKFKHSPNIWVDLAGKYYQTFGDFTYFTVLPWYKLSRISQYIYSGLFTLR